VQVEADQPTAILPREVNDAAIGYGGEDTSRDVAPSAVSAATIASDGAASRVDQGASAAQAATTPHEPLAREAFSFLEEE
jgi:hypothetical protein